MKKIIRLLSLCALFSVPVLAQDFEEEPSEREMALEYYLPMAQLGSDYAQLTIGEIYMQGAEIDKNLVEAFAWLSVARQQGVDEADELLVQLRKELSADQLSLALEQAQRYVGAYSLKPKK